MTQRIAGCARAFKSTTCERECSRYCRDGQHGVCYGYVGKRRNPAVLCACPCAHPLRRPEHVPSRALACK